jgi:hypothetical protein
MLGELSAAEVPITRAAKHDIRDSCCAATFLPVEVHARVGGDQGGDCAVKSIQAACRSANGDRSAISSLVGFAADLVQTGRSDRSIDI